MQPHSMCALALAGYMWNRPEPLRLSKMTMRVEYQKAGSYKANIYELSDIYQTADQREIRVRIMRAGGGLSCTVNIRRGTAQEGAEVTMTHDTIHISGLREVFNLYKTKIVSGRHYNSEKYGNFGGEFVTPDRKRLKLYCEVKQSRDYYRTVGYDLEIMQVIKS